VDLELTKRIPPARPQTSRPPAIATPRKSPLCSLHHLRTPSTDMINEKQTSKIEIGFPIRSKPKVVEGVGGGCWITVSCAVIAAKMANTREVR